MAAAGPGTCRYEKNTQRKKKKGEPKALQSRRATRRYICIAIRIYAKSCRMSDISKCIYACPYVYKLLPVWRCPKVSMMENPRCDSAGH